MIIIHDFTQYLDEVKSLYSYNTWYTRKQFLNKLVDKDLYKVAIDILDDEKLKDSSKSTMLIIIKAAMEYYEKYDRKLFRLIKSFKPNKTVQKCPTDKEVELIYNGLATARERAMFSLMCYNGLRISEIVNLDMDDLNIEMREMLIRDTKGKRDTIIPLVHTRVLMNLMDYLSYERLDSPSKALFISDRYDRYNVGTAKNLVHKWCDDNGLNHLHAHSFRRYFANTLNNKHISLQLISIAMRHASVATTMKYLNIDEKQTRGALEEAFEQDAERFFKKRYV